jgi:hypothetical protein
LLLLPGRKLRVEAQRRRRDIFVDNPFPKKFQPHPGRHIREIIPRRFSQGVAGRIPRQIPQARRRIPHAVPLNHMPPNWQVGLEVRTSVVVKKNHLEKREGESGGGHPFYFLNVSGSREMTISRPNYKQHYEEY